MFPLPLHIYFELAAAISASIFLAAPSRSRLGWFIPFLWMIVAVEISARYFTYVLLQPNAWLYSLSVPCEYLFYAFIFKGAYHNKLFKKIATGFMIAFFIYAIISLVFITGMKFFDMNLLVAGSAAMVVLCVLYFIDLYNQSDEVSIFAEPMFWIATGIFLFNAGEFCYNLLSKLLFESAFDSRLEVFRSINNRLILVLYSCFIIGFICRKISGTYKKDLAAM